MVFAKPCVPFQKAFSVSGFFVPSWITVVPFLSDPDDVPRMCSVSDCVSISNDDPAGDTGVTAKVIEKSSTTNASGLMIDQSVVCRALLR